MTNSMISMISVAYTSATVRTVSWVPYAAAEYQVVERKTYGSDDWVPVSSRLAASVSSFADSNLPANSGVRYRIRTVLATLLDFLGAAEQYLVPQETEYVSEETVWASTGVPAPKVRLLRTGATTALVIMESPYPIRYRAYSGATAIIASSTKPAGKDRFTLTGFTASDSTWSVTAQAISEVQDTATYGSSEVASDVTTATVTTTGVASAPTMILKNRYPRQATEDIELYVRWNHTAPTAIASAAVAAKITGGSYADITAACSVTIQDASLVKVVVPAGTINGAWASFMLKVTLSDYAGSQYAEELFVGVASSSSIFVHAADTGLRLPAFAWELSYPLTYTLLKSEVELWEGAPAGDPATATVAEAFRKSGTGTLLASAELGPGVTSWDPGVSVYPSKSYTLLVKAWCFPFIGTNGSSWVGVKWTPTYALPAAPVVTGSEYDPTIGGAIFHLNSAALSATDVVSLYRADGTLAATATGKPAQITDLAPYLRGVQNYSLTVTVAGTSKAISAATLSSVDTTPPEGETWVYLTHTESGSVSRLRVNPGINLKLSTEKEFPLYEGGVLPDVKDGVAQDSTINVSGQVSTLDTDPRIARRDTWPGFLSLTSEKGTVWYRDPVGTRKLCAIQDASVVHGLDGLSTVSVGLVEVGG